MLFPNVMMTWAGCRSTAGELQSECGLVVLEPFFFLRGFDFFLSIWSSNVLESLEDLFVVFRNL